MAVEAKFKRTDAGIIPNDWKIALLPEVCKFQSGKAHEPFISEFGRFICVNSKFISSEGRVQKRCTRSILTAKKSDILMVMSDLPNGRALAKVYLVEADNLYAVNQRICVLTVFKESPKYLAYVLNRNPYFLKFDDGVSQTHLLNPIFAKCPIPLPPTKSEQEAIANALGDADALIESLEKLIAKKRLIKKGAMQELLTGKRRLPGFSGEWTNVLLRQTLVQSATYGIVTAGQFVEEGVPMLRSGEIGDGSISGFIPNVTREKAAEYSRTSLKKNDVVIALVGYPGATARIPDSLEGGNISRAVGLLRFKPLVHPDFMVQFLNSSIGRKLVLAPSAGSAQQVVNLGALNKLELTIPDPFEQSAIAEILVDFDLEIFEHQKKLSKARLLKQGMMQELLTGRIRLI